MIPVHPGKLLKIELEARKVSANGLARSLRVPPGRIIDIINGKRAVSAETALRLGRYFGNGGRDAGRPVQCQLFSFLGATRSWRRCGRW